MLGALVDTAPVFFSSLKTFPPERCFQKEGPIQTFPSPFVKCTAFVPSLKRCFTEYESSFCKLISSLKISWLSCLPPLTSCARLLGRLCRQQFWHGPGAQGNINLQGFPYFAFTCLKLFQNLATEIQVIKHTFYWSVRSAASSYLRKDDGE